MFFNRCKVLSVESIGLLHLVINKYFHFGFLKVKKICIAYKNNISIKYVIIIGGNFLKHFIDIIKKYKLTNTEYFFIYYIKKLTILSAIGEKADVLVTVVM